MHFHRNRRTPWYLAAARDDRWLPYSEESVNGNFLMGYELMSIHDGFQEAQFDGTVAVKFDKVSKARRWLSYI